MAKLLVALSLLCGGANAMGIYGGEKNGCGDPCKAVVTLNTEPFDPIESDTCYVVDGTFPSDPKCYDTPVTVLYPGSKTCPQS